jgi:hypothetical protein
MSVRTVIWLLRQLLSYLTCTIGSQGHQRKEPELKDAAERERIKQEKRRLEGEKRWECVSDEWLRDVGMGEEAGCVGDDVE